MNRLLGVIVVTLVMQTAHAGVIYDFYGYDDCPAGSCTTIATGTLWLNDDLSFSDWQFRNLLTGTSYTLSDPAIAGFNGLFGTLPASSGIADILLDFIGENTFFTTGPGAEVNGMSGLPAGWQHSGIEALQPTDEEGNITPLQQQLNQMALAGATHSWVRQLQEIPEPGMLALLGLALTSLAACRSLRFRNGR